MRDIEGVEPQGQFSILLPGLPDSGFNHRSAQAKEFKHTLVERIGGYPYSQQTIGHLANTLVHGTSRHIRIDDTVLEPHANRGVTVWGAEQLYRYADASSQEAMVRNVESALTALVTNHAYPDLLQ